ncbi:MAG: glycosyltransferase family 2 protein [Patescibacteria group bacterium]|jgi:glycosyltransferase involved in cell wall biosynthesis
MNKIILSIIIPTHNSQNSIEPLLLSINNSSSVNFKKLEVIVFDDGSKDNTLKVIKRVKKTLNFSLLIINSQINVGPAKARNLGAKKAKGDYLLFLDGDVELKKQTLNNVFKTIKNGKVKAFTGIWDYHQKTTNFFPQFKALRDWSYWFIEREEYSHYYLFSTRIAGIEKKLFHKLNGFIEDYKEPTVEDIEFTYRIEKETSIKFCSNVVVNHEFEDFLPIAVKYYKRSRDWIKLYLKRFKFDPVATSKREAFKSIISSFIIFFIFISILFRLFLFPAILLFIIFFYLEFKFWRFILQKKGFLFLLYSIPVSIILYQFINVGAAWGYATSKLKIKN